MIGHIELFVPDPIEASNLYQKVFGFELTETQPGPFVWLKSDSVELLLRPGKPTGTAAYEKLGMVLVIYAKDVAAQTASMNNNGFRLLGDDSPGCPVYSDPYGLRWQIVSA